MTRLVQRDDAPDAGGSWWDRAKKTNDDLSGRTALAQGNQAAENFLVQGNAKAAQQQNDWIDKNTDKDSWWRSAGHGLTAVNKGIGDFGTGTMMGALGVGEGMLNVAAHPLDAAVGVADMAINDTSIGKSAKAIGGGLWDLASGKDAGATADKTMTTLGATTGLSKYGNLAGNLWNTATGDQTLSGSMSAFGDDSKKEKQIAGPDVADKMLDPFVKDVKAGNYALGAGRAFGTIGATVAAGEIMAPGATPAEPLPVPEGPVSAPPSAGPSTLPGLGPGELPAGPTGPATVRGVAPPGPGGIGPGEIPPGPVTTPGVGPAELPNGPPTLRTPYAPEGLPPQPAPPVPVEIVEPPTPNSGGQPLSGIPESTGTPAPNGGGQPLSGIPDSTGVPQSGGPSSFNGLPESALPEPVPASQAGTGSAPPSPAVEPVPGGRGNLGPPTGDNPSSVPPSAGPDPNSPLLKPPPSGPPPSTDGLLEGLGRDSGRFRGFPESALSPGEGIPPTEPAAPTAPQKLFPDGPESAGPNPNSPFFDPPPSAPPPSTEGLLEGLARDSGRFRGFPKGGLPAGD